MSIFTSTPCSGNVKPPVLFIENGNATDVACKLSEVDIQAFGRPANGTVDIFFSQFEYAVAATILSKSIIPASLKGGFIRAIPSSLPPNFFNLPSVGINFPANALSPDVESGMKALGFTKISVGRLRYYEGVITPSDLQRLPKGATWQTAVAPGTTNIPGLAAFSMTVKLLWGALAARERDVTTVSPLRYSLKHVPVEFTAVESAQPNALKISPAKKENIKTHATPAVLADDIRKIGLRGYILPYFHNLIVPDHIYTTNLFLGLFPHILADTVEDSAKARAGFREGWKSLSKTQVGLELSHALFCLNLANTTGCKPVVLFDTTTKYLGTALLSRKGAEITIFKGAHSYSPMEPEALASAIEELDSHSTALDAIAEYLTSNERVDADGDTTQVEPLLDCPKILITKIGSARTLHNIVRDLKLKDEDVKFLRSQIKRLHFSQSFLNPRSAKDILTVYQAIARKEYLDDNYPIYHLGPAMLSNSIEHSALSAFGKIAPVFCDPRPGQTVIIPPIENPEETWGGLKLGNKYQAFKKDLPVYLVNLDEAVVSVRNMRKTGSLNVNVSNKGDVINVSTRLQMKEAEVVMLTALLSEHFSITPTKAKGKAQGEKRRRNSEDETLEKRVRRTKKASAEEDMLSTLMSISGIAPDQAWSSMVVEED